MFGRQTPGEYLLEMIHSPEVLTFGLIFALFPLLLSIIKIDSRLWSIMLNGFFSTLVAFTGSVLIYLWHIADPENGDESFQFIFELASARSLDEAVSIALLPMMLCLIGALLLQVLAEIIRFKRLKTSPSAKVAKTVI